MNVWNSLRRLFGATPKTEQPNITWADEFERLRKLRAQRIAIASKQAGQPEILALPVREMGPQ